MRNIVIFFIILFFSISGTIARETPSKNQYQSLSANNGLPHNAVSSFYKDKSGLMWIGTRRGVASFDGNSIRTFPSTEDDDVWAITQLDGDTLLLGTLNGLRWLCAADGVAGKIDMPSIVVRSILSVNSENTLVGTEKGLFMLTGKRLKRIPIENSINSSNYITEIISDKDASFWFSTADGLGYLDSKLKPTIYRQYETSDRSNNFTSLVKCGDYIYLGTFNKGIFRFHIPTKKFHIVDGFQHELIMKLQADKSYLYIGTNGEGLKTMCLKTGNIEYSIHNNKDNGSIVSNTITALRRENGITWIGTQFGGISYDTERKKRFVFFRHKDFHSEDYNVRSVHIFPEGDKLIGTRTGVYYVPQDSDGGIRSWNSIASDHYLRSGIILYIGQVTGKTLVGTYGGGVYVFDRVSRTLKDLCQEEFGIYGRIFHFVDDSDGNIWFATQAGLYKTTPDGKVLAHYMSENSVLHADPIYFLCFDAKRRLWLATKFGLILFDPLSGKMIEGIEGLPPECDIKYIIRDSADRMWLCTNSGVFCMNQDLKILKHLDTSNILPENHATTIIQIKKDVFLISTLHNIVEYNVESEDYTVFWRHDGLGEGDFNGMVALDCDSTLYWTNENGLITTNLKSLHANTDYERTPILTSAIIDGNELAYPFDDLNNIKLNVGQSVSLRFSYMDFRNPETNCFEFILEGYDNEWRLLSEDFSVEYDDLPAGNYTLRLRMPEGKSESVYRLNVSYSSISIIVMALITISIIAILAFLSYRIIRLRNNMRNRTKLFISLKKEKTEKASSVSPLAEELLRIMEEEKPWQNPKLRIGDVAQSLHCTQSELSSLLNEKMNTNFTTFINTFRVEAIKTQLNDENLKRYTISSLALKYGFSTKVTFYRAFKSIVGMTPKEYCKSKGMETTID